MPVIYSSNRTTVITEKDALKHLKEGRATDGGKIRSTPELIRMIEEAKFTRAANVVEGWSMGRTERVALAVLLQCSGDLTTLDSDDFVCDQCAIGIDMFRVDADGLGQRFAGRPGPACVSGSIVGGACAACLSRGEPTHCTKKTGAIISNAAIARLPVNFRVLASMYKEARERVEDSKMRGRLDPLDMAPKTLLGLVFDKYVSETGNAPEADGKPEEK